MCQTSSVRWGWGIGLSLVAGLAVGCGGDDPDSWPPERPRIDVVTFVGQSPRDPLGLQFSLSFVDGDGDLGGGRLDLSVGEQPAGTIALEALFAAQRPAVAADATAGEVEVLVRLSEAPAASEDVTIGFVLEDAAGHRSNEPKTTLAVQ